MVGMKFTTTITQANWDMKMEDHKKRGHFWEYKSMIDHWNKRIPKLVPPCPGVFVIGRIPHLVEIQEVLEGKKHQIPKRYGSFVTTEECYMLKCVLV